MLTDWVSRLRLLIRRTGSGLVEDFGRDVRYGLRQLRRSPAFAAAALLCLALGIGATTAIYSLVSTILLQPLPFRDSDRLVTIVENVPPPAPGRPLMQRGLTYQEFLDWREKARTLSDATAVAGGGQRLVRTRDRAVGLWGGTAAPDMFTMLGVRAHLGRTLVPGDEADPSVVVLSYEAWQRHFNGDPAILGTPLEFSAGALIGPAPARLLTVVGILPPDFELSGVVDFYSPMPRNFPFRVTTIGRLSPGVSLAAAIDEANIMGAAIRPPWPASAPQLTGPRFQVHGLKDGSVQHLRPAFRVLLASVVVVLLIVCANVANLLLARGTARQRELAVRVAIGARRARIAQQIMTECLVLVVAGGALGALVGAGGLMLVKQLAAIEAPGVFRFSFGASILPRVHEIGIDMTMLGIAFGFAALTTVICGVLPALHLSRTTHAPALGSRGGSAGRGESRIRAALTVGQVTMATVLLVGAGLLTHSFVKLSAVNNGYDPANVLAFNLLFPNQYPVARKADTIDALLTRLRAAPDVTAAGFSRHGILIGEELFIGTFVPPGRGLQEMRAVRNRVRSVSRGYLTAMGVPLIDGREFDARDDAGAPPTIVMNRSAARQYFGAIPAVGRVVDWHYGPGQTQPVTVVGVVEDIRQTSPTDKVFPEIFVEYRQFLSLLDRWAQPQRQNELAIGFLSFAIRTGGDPTRAVPVVRDIVKAVDPNVGIEAIVPMTSLAANTVARQRFYAVMLAAFAGIAGVLAVIGIYGLLAYAVVQRTQEIGVRLSLGAPPAQVLGLILRQGLLLTTVGITLGIIGATVVTGLLQDMLFGITPLDTRTFLAVSIVFALVATIACWVPAHRATKIDPIVALRTE